MSKAVLLSIQPKLCELIASVKKTIEVRKSKPKIETPFKCYIYCTNPRHYVDSKHWFSYPESPLWRTANNEIKTNQQRGDGDCVLINGKVIGEFVCDRIIDIDCDSVAPFDKSLELYIDKQCQMSREDMWKYTGGRCAYGFHISRLVIYDKPKELSEFKKYNRNCKYGDLGFAIPKCDTCKDCNLKRPPQSWCYVEDVAE